MVVANFSDFFTANPSSPGAEYRVELAGNPAGAAVAREVTQERCVPQEYVGRESMFPWEAKVYTLATESQQVQRIRS